MCFFAASVTSTCWLSQPEDLLCDWAALSLPSALARWDSVLRAQTVLRSGSHFTEEENEAGRPEDTPVLTPRTQDHRCLLLPGIGVKAVGGNEA
jgi:hypothetical protein